MTDCEARPPASSTGAHARGINPRHLRGQADEVIMRIGVVAVLSLVAAGCASSRVLHDSDGNSYRVKTMADGRTWTTDNARLVLPGSYCHDDAASQCLRFGRLYTWAAAVQVCSRLGAGWRLPTDDEWRQLARGYEACWAIPSVAKHPPTCSRGALQASMPFLEATARPAALMRAVTHTVSTGPPPSPTTSMRGSTISAAAASIGTEAATSRWPCQCGVSRHRRQGP